MRFDTLITMLAIFTASSLAIECGVDSECDQTSNECWCNGKVMSIFRLAWNAAEGFDSQEKTATTPDFVPMASEGALVSKQHKLQEYP